MILAIAVAHEQVAYWRRCGLRLRHMWAAVGRRPRGCEADLVQALAADWLDCRRELRRRGR